jgi:hypothetical protein
MQAEVDAICCEHAKDTTNLHYRISLETRHAMGLETTRKHGDTTKEPRSAF